MQQQLTPSEHGALFPNLNRFGNYDAGAELPSHLARISTDGTIRKIKRLGIPYVAIVSLELAYGKTYKPVTYGYAIPQEYLPKLQSEPAKKQPKPHPDLVLCIREASRAAHRERDAAQSAYQQRRHLLAGNAKRRKDGWYTLKDRGIVAAHQQGLVRYIGRTPQDLAVYEYGEGGMSCFHSTLHPKGVDRSLVEGHPEILSVEAKEKVQGVSLRRVEITLGGLPSAGDEYERSHVPRVARSEAIVCFKCGEPGHIARHCLIIDDDEDEEFAEAVDLACSDL